MKKLKPAFSRILVELVEEKLSELIVVPPGFSDEKWTTVKIIACGPQVGLHADSGQVLMQIKPGQLAVCNKTHIARYELGRQTFHFTEDKYIAAIIEE